MVVEVVLCIVLSSYPEGVGFADTIPGFAVRQAKGKNDPGVPKNILALRRLRLEGSTTKHPREVTDRCPAACNLACTDSRRRLLPVADSGLRGYAPVAPGPEAKRAAGIGIGEAIVFSYFFEGVALFTLPALTVAQTQGQADAFVHDCVSILRPLPLERSKARKTDAAPAPLQIHCRDVARRVPDPPRILGDSGGICPGVHRVRGGGRLQALPAARARGVDVYGAGVAAALADGFAVRWREGEAELLECRVPERRRPVGDGEGRVAALLDHTFEVLDAVAALPVRDDLHVSLPTHVDVVVLRPCPVCLLALQALALSLACVYLV